MSDEFPSDLRIHSQRFRANFEALAAIGATAEGGVHRPALSEAHRAARRWFLEMARDAGLETRVDGAGNHSALLRCARPGAPVLMLGSHLDSVPHGGRYDGALGVAAALEVLQTVQDHDLTLAAHLEAIDFTDEEGHYVNLLGSQALTGRLRPDHVENARGGRERFREALASAGLSEPGLYTAGRDSSTLAGYLELHVEQGGRLAEQGHELGIVSGIVGIRSFHVRFLGRADHAGTTPLPARMDAGLGASAFCLAVRQAMVESFPECVATVGKMAFEPGAFNVVPQAVTVALEFRAADGAELDRIEARLRDEARNAASQHGLGLEIEHLDSIPPAPMDPRVQAAIASACRGLDLDHVTLASGAGHDAQSLAAVCPTGMVFVPSVGGRSHSALEFTEWEDCVHGANVLLQAALRLARA